MSLDWQPCNNLSDLARTGADFIAAAARTAIADHGRFRLVLAGGGTPLACYRLLAATDQAWASWELYYGDERCLPADHPERNSHMVAASGLSGRIANDHPIAAELGAETACARYATTITAAMPFDLVILGIGEDGHTASLFPGHPWPSPDTAAVAVHQAPKPPPERVSLTPAALRNSAQQLVLISGAGKADIVDAWRNGADLPIARVTQDQPCRILVEKSAWRLPAVNSRR